MPRLSPPAELRLFRRFANPASAVLDDPAAELSCGVGINWLLSCLFTPYVNANTNSLLACFFKLLQATITSYVILLYNIVDLMHRLHENSINPRIACITLFT